MTIALGLGYSADRRSIHNRTVIRELGPPCVRVPRGPRKGQPSLGCKRIARLVAEQCRSTPKLCLPIVTLLVSTSQGRRLVQRELRHVLGPHIGARSGTQGTTPASQPGARGGGPRAPSLPPTIPMPVPAPAPPSVPGMPPPPQRLPGVISGIVHDPGGAVQNPQGALHDLGCALNICPQPLPLTLPPVP